MNNLLEEIKTEIKARLDSAKRELKSLEDSSVRIAELKEFISHAEEELASVSARISKSEKSNSG